MFVKNNKGQFFVCEGDENQYEIVKVFYNEMKALSWLKQYNKQ